MNEQCKLEKEEYLELRKRLQKARYQVLEDGENWLGIAQAIEAVGKALAKKYKVTQCEQKKVGVTPLRMLLPNSQSVHTELVFRLQTAVFPTTDPS